MYKRHIIPYSQSFFCHPNFNEPSKSQQWRYVFFSATCSSSGIVDWLLTTIFADAWPMFVEAIVVAAGEIDAAANTPYLLDATSPFDIDVASAVSSSSVVSSSSSDVSSSFTASEGFHQQRSPSLSSAFVVSSWTSTSMFHSKLVSWPEWPNKPVSGIGVVNGPETAVCIVSLERKGFNDDRRSAVSTFAVWKFSIASRNWPSRLRG